MEYGCAHGATQRDLKREAPDEMKQGKYKLIVLCIRFHIPGDNTAGKS